MRKLALLGIGICAACLCSAPNALGQANAVDAEGHAWWQHAVFYEIYPRSFADSNNDGIGDLNGIASKLDYLKQLGVDAIWISPCFPSPQVDFGYDVSDYENIDPMYGTLADFDHLAVQRKKHDIRIILDLRPQPHLRPAPVVHRFPLLAYLGPARLVHLARRQRPRAAAQQLDFPVRPFGVGVSIPKTGQYYYHIFYPQQPDLNWRNPEVRKRCLT